MKTYEDFYEEYKARLDKVVQNMTVDTMPEMRALSQALYHLQTVETERDEEVVQRRWESETAAFHAWLLQWRDEWLQGKHREDDADDDVLHIIYNVGKIAALAAVAYFAPPLLGSALPIVGAVGTATNAAATGVAMGAVDAAVQGAGTIMGMQDHVSGREVLETAIAGTVGTVTAGLPAMPHTTAVAAAAAGTQVVEMQAGMRDAFDLKDVGLQAASALIASGIQETMPKLAEKVGTTKATQVAAAAANTAINAVLQHAANGVPIDLATMASQVAGSIAGSKIGEAVVDRMDVPKAAPVLPQKTKRPVPASHKTQAPPEKGPLCTANDGSFFEKWKMTPLPPRKVDNEVLELLGKGKFAEAKKAALKGLPKHTYTPWEERKLPKANVPDTSPAAPSQGTVANPDASKAKGSTATILSKMNGAYETCKDTASAIWGQATPFEKAVMVGLGVSAGALALPEAVVASLGAIANALTIGPITEAVLIDTLANPAFLQAASRAGILFGSSGLAVKEIEALKRANIDLHNVPENMLFHTVTSAGSGQGVLNGINTTFFNIENRFGEAFYLSEIPETTLAELKFKNAIGTHTIRFHFNRESARVLDLTNPQVAKQWGYNASDPYDITRSINLKAKTAGYNAIRYHSVRSDGANLAILKDFDTLLKPQMIVPAPVQKVSKLIEFNKSITGEKQQHAPTSLRL